MATQRTRAALDAGQPSGTSAASNDAARFGSLRRRGLLRAGCLFCCAGGVGSVLAAAATEPGSGAGSLPTARAENGLGPALARPAADSDEGGLWGLMDREEKRLRQNAELLRDAHWNRYFGGLVQRLAGVHAPQIRPYTVRIPWFNASIAPNGMMQLWSGLLLRLENEAQLVAVLGHELAHYSQRHSLLHLRDIKSRSAATLFMLPFGLLGLGGMLALAARGASYSRNQETEADLVGVGLMRHHGYDTRQAALVWQQLMAEQKANDKPDKAAKSPMFATHPQMQERALALEQATQRDAAGELGAQAYWQALNPLLPTLLGDEVARGEHGETVALMNRLMALQPEQAHFVVTRAEVQRLRGQPADLENALVDYTAATQMEGAPASAWRGLGLLHRQWGRREPAVQALTKFLELAPEAADAGLIRAYIAGP